MKIAKIGAPLFAAVLVGACANMPDEIMVSDAWLRSSTTLGTDIPSAAVTISDKRIGPNGETLFTAVDGRSGDAYACSVNVGKILPYLPPPAYGNHPANCRLINAKPAR